MQLPSLTNSGIAMILYFLLLLIVSLGIWQFVKFRYLLKAGEKMRLRSMVPLGWTSLAFGFIGFFNHYQAAFDLIEAAGDISPGIVAQAMRPAFSYPVLGLLCLAGSYIFRFVNQYEITVIKE